MKKSRLAPFIQDVRTTLIAALTLVSLVTLPPIQARAGEVSETRREKYAGRALSKEDREKLDKELEAIGLIKAPFSACEDVNLVDSDKYKSNHEAWRQAQNDGKVDGEVEIVPTSSIAPSFKVIEGYRAAAFNMRDRALKPSELPPNEFLVKVGQRAVADMKTGIDKLKELQMLCAIPMRKQDYLIGGSIPKIKPDPKACAERKAMLLKPVEKEASNFARALGMVNLQLDETRAKAAVARGDSSIYINAKLDAVTAGVLAPARSPELAGDDLAHVKEATKANFAKAKEAYKEFINKTIADRGAKGPDAEKIRNELNKPEALFNGINQWMRENHTQKAQDEYNKLLGEYPQLAYLSTSKPSDSDFAAALAKMIADADSVRVATEATLHSRKKSVDRKAIDPNLAVFGSYTGIIDRMLKEEAEFGKPKNCAIATAMWQEHQAIKTVEGLQGAGALIGSVLTGALGAGRLGAAGIIPANAVKAIPAAIGVAGGVGMGIVSYADVMQVEAQARAGVTKIDDVKDDIASGSLTVPFMSLDVYGGKAIFVGKALVGVTTAVVGAAGAAAVKNAVRSGAKEAAETAAAKQLPNSLDPVTRKALENAQAGKEGSLDALAKVADANLVKILGRSPDAADKELIAALAERGVSPAIVSEYAATTKTLTAPERQQLGKNVAELLMGTTKPKNPAELKKYNEQADNIARAALAFARNGIDSPKTIATLLSDKQWWDSEALDVATKVLTDSNRAMRDKVRAGMQPMKAKAEAVQDSISMTAHGKPYAKLDDAQRAKVNQMCICIAQCPTTVAMDETAPAGRSIASVSPATEIDWSKPASLRYQTCAVH